MFKANINALQKAGIRDDVIVMVGGAPVTQEYADAVGADGYAADASTAVRLAKDLIEKRRSRRPRVMKPLALVEAAVKKPVFGCQMCGQCVLHSTGMTCPMNCPKTLRNGPCGGVRPDGHCEVKPEMRCVWVKAVERAPKTPWAHEIDDIRKPVDNRLVGHVVVGELRDEARPVAPKGWRVEA